MASPIAIGQFLSAGGGPCGWGVEVCCASGDSASARVMQGASMSCDTRPSTPILFYSVMLCGVPSSLDQLLRLTNNTAAAFDPH